MATKYGYRIFSVALYRGFKTTAEEIPSAALGSGSNEEALDATIKAVCGENLGKTHTEVLRYREPKEVSETDGGVEDTTPFIRLLSFDLSASSRFDFEYKFGRRGSHDLAMAANESDDAPLDDKAPANTYRAFLYLPKAGTKAILVAEARNRLCPGLDLLKLVGVGSKAIDTGRPENERIGWWRFIGARITDEVQMLKFIRQGHASYIELRKNIISGSSKPHSDVLRVRQDGLPIPKKLDAAKVLVGSWFGLSSDDLGVVAVEPAGKTVVSQLASLLEVNIDPSQFDDGGVGWEGPDGTTHFVRPDDLEDAFTYRVGKPGYRPTNDELRLDAESTLRNLQGKLKIDLDI